MCTIRLENVSVIYRLIQSNQQDAQLKANQTFQLSAMDNVSISIAEKDKVGIIGRNGGGKSTLLAVLSGDLIPHKGTVDIQGNKLALLKRTSGLIPKASLTQNAKMKAFSLGLAGKEVDRYIENVLSGAGLQHRAQSKLSSLSTGMSGKFNIALNSQLVKEINILDEWVGTLEMQDKSGDGLLNMLTHQAKIVVLASHNESIIRKLCNRVILMEQGKILYDGRDMDAAFARFELTKTINHNSHYSPERLIQFFAKYENHMNSEFSLSNKIKRELAATTPKKNQPHSDFPASQQMETQKKTKLHYLHTSKSGSWLFKQCLRDIQSDKYEIVLHKVGIKLRNIPEGDKIIISVRDPIERFCRAFNARQSRGAPFYSSQWSSEEEFYFSKFKKFNQLAESLSSPILDVQCEAFEAMHKIGHIQNSLEPIFGDKGYFLSRKEDFYFISSTFDVIGSAEQLLRTLKANKDIKQILDQETIDYFNYSYRSKLSDIALENLKIFYKRDLDHFKFIESLK